MKNTILSRSLFLAVLTLGSLFTSIAANAQVITAYAGTGTLGCTGDGGPATAATFWLPSSAATDAHGNIFIADCSNNMVRKVDAMGVITSVAGDSSIIGFSGDGGPATLAKLDHPIGVACDRAGNLYICDADNNRIRKVDTAGIITTIAGTTSGGYNGDGIPATSAKLDMPQGVAVDTSGNIYIADYYNSRIRIVSPAGIINTFAGTGSFGFSGDGGFAYAAAISFPGQVYVDAHNIVYFSDLWNHRVRQISPSNIISTVVGTGASGVGGDGGPATAAQLSSICGIAIDGYGNLYLADLAENKVRKVDAAGIITTFAGTGALGRIGDGGPATLAKLSSPQGVCVDAVGIVYITDTRNNRIRMVCPALPVIAGTITGVDSVCVGFTSALHATVPGGVWSSLNPSVVTISSTGVVSGIAVGQDTVMYVISNLCTSDTGIYVMRVINSQYCHTGLSNTTAKTQAELVVSPNPSHGDFVLSLLSPASGEAQITITNILGEKVEELQLQSGNSVSLKLAAPKGIYFVSAVIGGQQLSSKIVIE
jgi:sugar lactone lactonase YvrE